MQQYLAWLEGQTFCSLPAYCTWKRQKGMLLVRFLDAQTLFLVGFFFLDLRRPLFSPNPEPQCLACWKIQQDLRLLGGFSLGYFPHILQRRKKRDFFLFGFFSCAESRLQCWRLRLPGPLIAERVFTFDTKIMDCWTTKLPMDYALYFEQMTKINNISFRHW